MPAAAAPLPLLYEREAPLARLVARIAALPREGGGVVLLVGEAGVGKTSLIEQLRRSTPPRVEWLACTCEPLLAPPALAPLIDLLQALPPSLAAAVQCARLTSEVMASFEERLLGGTQQRVLVVDDAQWADGATLELLRHLGRRCAAAALLLLVAWREEAAEALAGFEATLAGAHLWRETLAPLSAAAVATWAARCGRAASDLHRVTQGNPYFVAQLLEAERGQAPSDAGPGALDSGPVVGPIGGSYGGSYGSSHSAMPGATSRGLPGAVRDAVFARALPLQGEAREALELAAVAPGGLTLEVMGAVIEAPQRALAPGVAAGLLQLDGGAVRFRHELARQAVEAALAPQRAAALHQAVFDALGLYGAAATRRLHHAVHGGLAAAVLELAPLAAREAAEGGAWREAATLYALARQRAAALPAAEQAALAVAHARACVPANRLDDALAARQRALQLHRSLGDALATAIDERELARLHWMRGRSPQALPHAEAALALLDTLPPAPRERAETLATLADLHILDERAERAATLAAAAEEALRAHEAAGARDDALRAHVLCMSAGARLRRADDAAAWQALRESLSLAQVAGDRERVLRACMSMATMGLVHHRREHGLRALREGLACCEAHDIDLYAARLKIRLAYGTLFQGGLAEAGAMLRELRAQAPLPPLEDEQSQHALMLVGLRAGDAAATAYWRQAVAGERRLSIDPWHAPQDVSCIEAAWLLGDETASRSVLRERALPAALASGEGWRIGAVLVWARRLGLPPPQRDPFEPDSPPCAPLQLELEGAIEAAAQAWAARGCRGEEVLTLLQASDDAPALLERALAQAESSGAAPLAARASARLRALGYALGHAAGRRPPGDALPRRRQRAEGTASSDAFDASRWAPGELAANRATAAAAAPHALTARERQVLAGIERGQSNRAIAAALALSERTVQGHVTSLMAKLGANRRAQLARAASESPPANGDCGRSG